MLSAEELLRDYGRLLWRLRGAESVSLYLPSAPQIRERSWLVHANGRPAVPELADAGAARNLPSAGVRGMPWWQPVASRAADGLLFPVPADRAPESHLDGAERRRPGAADDPPVLWIGVRMAPEASPPASDVWRRALAHGGALAAYCRRTDAVLRDPVTGLPGRADFQAVLRRAAAAALEHDRPLALLLANPDDFRTINERFGSDVGDAVVLQIARRLRQTLRSADPVHRYGGVVFAVVLPGIARADAVAVAEKLHDALTGEGYLDGALRLGFSLGLATLDGIGGDADQAARELIRRADRALSEAKVATNGRVRAWRPGTGEQVVAHRDRLNGIFTADLAKDYRNMLLLWDAVDIMTARADPGALGRRVLERLAASFRPDRAALCRWSEASKGGVEIAAGFSRDGRGSRGAGEPDLAAAELALLEQARAEGELVAGSLPAAEAAYAVPLMARGGCLGCLYLAGPGDALRLDASDLIFLRALAGQLAAALDRAELAERERRVKEREGRRLRAELEQLRAAARQAQLVYGSSRMEALLDTARRAAPTDATVLVTGPSGSGKELVARMVHELSPRRAQPPVVVDCGAISATLIDSELFGHEKGAYTGAAGRTAGRLAEAAGSTVILDEIGELPLEVQSKLLRFVQEKEITPVGGSRPRAVDARLVAVTNRDLEAEVAAGRFREDLYYRLKVVHLEVPALAERPEDVQLLIDHFVERFAARYRKDVRGISPEAAALAARYPWPGNVRELENRILQAVILSEGEEIGPGDLALDVAAARARSLGEAGLETLELDLARLEKRHIERILADEEGGLTQSARRLGIHRSTLYEKLKKYGIERPG